MKTQQLAPNSLFMLILISSASGFIVLLGF